MEALRGLSVVLAAVVAACGAESSESPRPARPGETIRPDEGDSSGGGLVGATEFPLTVLDSLVDARVRTDLPAKRAKEEIAYTERWLGVALRPAAMRQMRGVTYRLVSGLGARDDDGVVTNADIDGRGVVVVDGRELLFQIHTAPEVESVESVWWQLFGRGAGSAPSGEELVVDEAGATTRGGTYGTIRPVEEPRRWFSLPARWYRLDDRLVFAFEKRLVGQRRTPDDSPVPVRVAVQFFGGIPFSDDRPFLRFDPTNRESLAKELAREHCGEGPGRGDAPFEAPPIGAPIAVPQRESE